MSYDSSPSYPNTGPPPTRPPFTPPTPARRSYGSQPYDDQPYGTRPQGGRPYGNQSQNSRPYGGQPYDRQPYGGDSGQGGRPHPAPGGHRYGEQGPTYPWQPAPAPEPPPERPAPVHAPLGHHSDLRILRGAYRWQRRTATLTALGYFVLFLLLSAFAPGFMAGTVTDGLPVGLLLALVQVPVTWLAIVLYEHTAHRYLDPIAARIREQARLDAKRGATR
ncbi:DUF485 domain-containing protein [Streptomyces sp. NPDC005017]|uniref:DUF485 domain-containing protein n=1 Tax=Streptomyces sp. NPDC005017 TaxID=3364706 RepID=UPI0036B51BD3